MAPLVDHLVYSKYGKYVSQYDRVIAVEFPLMELDSSNEV